MKISQIEIEQLSSYFAQAPSAPGHAHCTIREQIGAIGGESAILYGYWLAIPFRQRWRKADAGRLVSEALSLAAKQF